MANEREDLFFDVMKSFMSQNSQKQLKIIVIGETGQGKSTLINSLVGKKIAEEGDFLEPGTEHIKYYSLTQNTVNVQIWDTPGFGYDNPEKDMQMMEDLRNSDCYPHDLALFCIRMDETRFPKHIHTETIKRLTTLFDTLFWKHTMFVLTFANMVHQFCPEDKPLLTFFTSKHDLFARKIKETLQKQVPNLSENDLSKLKVVPVGAHKMGFNRENPWVLPDRADWFISFWVECTESMRQSAMVGLLRLNQHRLSIWDDPTAGNVLVPSHSLEPLTIEIEKACALEKSTEISTSKIVEDLSFKASTNIDSDAYVPPELVENLTINRSYEILSTEDICIINSNASEDSHTRFIPLHIILQNHLDKSNSGFLTYVTQYAKARGNSVPVLGHIEGFLEGLCEWLGSKQRKVNYIT